MLERWIRALEERDLETKGHTFRVTGMAVRLASALGLRGEELLNVRRGAFLHDNRQVKHSGFHPAQVWKA